MRSTGDRSDLYQAIAEFREVINMSPPGSDNKAVATGNLARALPDGYRQAGQAADAEEAQRLYVEAVSKIGPDHPAAAILASELWIALGQDLKK